MTTVTAMPHVRTSPVQRSRGDSAVAAAAYRHGERFTDERTGEIHDFRARGGVEDGFIVTPEGAEWAQDRSVLWNAAEHFERRSNSQTAREYIVGLPHELNKEERREVAEQFARELVQRYRVAVDVALHTPSADGDQRNWHMHVLTTTRTVDADGFGQKTRELDDQKQGPKEILALRERLAQIQNDALELAQVERRVDHRSNAERGIAQEPQKEHFGREITAERRAVAQEMAQIRDELQAMGIGAGTPRSDDPRTQARDAASAIDNWVEQARVLAQQMREQVRQQVERAAQVAREVVQGIGQKVGQVLGSVQERFERINREREAEGSSQAGREAPSDRFRRIEQERAAQPPDVPLTAAERLARAEQIGQASGPQRAVGERSDLPVRGEKPSTGPAEPPKPRGQRE